MSKQIILDQKIEKFCESHPELTDNSKDVIFQRFVLEKLSPYELESIDTEEIETGIIDGSGDLGIDAIYIFLNGSLINDRDMEEIKDKINKKSKVDAIFIQTKNRNGFDENGFRKFSDTIKRVLNLEEDFMKFKNLGANERFLEKVALLREIYREALYADVGENDIYFKGYYITRGFTYNIPKPILELKYETEEIINKQFIRGKFSIGFLGLDEILTLTERQPYSIELLFINPPTEIEIEDTPIKGYLGVVRAKDLLGKLVNDRGDLDKKFFEDNVRHFLGIDREINKNMKTTAQSNPQEFWLYNNGITMIADDISYISQKKYRLQNPQIVNGLQTIYSLHEASKEKEIEDNLCLTVKIVKTDNIETKINIISYTNSQNKMEEPSLKAIERIHRDIEEYLKPFGIYYERKINFYRSQNISGVNLINMKRMAQILWSVYQKEAIYAYNDVKEIFSSEEKYNIIFPQNQDIDLDHYLFASKLYIKYWLLKRKDVTSIKEESIKSLLSSTACLYCLLNVATCLLLSSTNKINISQKKNPFIQKKEEVLSLLDQNDYMETLYQQSKKIFLDAVFEYDRDNPRKVYKNRKFDATILIPLIKKLI